MRTVAAAGVALLIGLCSASTMAQTVMDGSKSAINDAEYSELMAAFRSRLNDPFGAQMMQLQKPSSDVTCGKVNTKNQHGGYVGFRTFALRDRTLKIWPAPSPKVSTAGLSYSAIAELVEAAKAELAEMEAIAALCPGMDN